MCKDLNIDVGPQALQCGPSICTFVTTNIHQNALDGEKTPAILARVVSNGHEYFISDFHVSSPWRQDYFYLPPPKWNGAQLSMGVFLLLFLEKPQAVTSRCSYVVARDMAEKKRDRTAGFIDLSEI